jgi:SAM-dependent methyltransferase
MHAKTDLPPSTNLDSRVVRAFGAEWKRFDQSVLSKEELETAFQSYFSIFPWQRLPQQAVGLDIGCGSGRWARFVAPRVGTLYCIDASPDAAAVARQNLRESRNCRVCVASVDAIPLRDACVDFGYAIGVLHHLPNPQEGLSACVAKLRRGAPFLLYLYYRLENQPWWYRAAWKMSDLIRVGISRAPEWARVVSSQIIAATVYFPLARLARFAAMIGLEVHSFPLSFYRHRSFYAMRNDALDRFGTRIERRFTRGEIVSTMERAGLGEIRFSDRPPFWCAVGVKL